MLSVKQSAEKFGVGEQTIRRAIIKNQLKSIRVGPKLIRIDENDLEEWIKNCNKDQ